MLRQLALSRASVGCGLHDVRGTVPPSMRARPAWIRWAAWAGFLALLALHLGPWRPAGGRAWLGWIPGELAWRLAWMLLAWLYLVFFCARVWDVREP